MREGRFACSLALMLARSTDSDIYRWRYVKDFEREVTEQGEGMDLILELAKEPFGAEAARELCRLPGIFNFGELYKRERICEVLREQFVRRGGSRDTSKQNIASVLKKWLGGGESPFRKEARGRYRFMGFPDQAEYADNSAGSPLQVSDSYDGDSLAPEKEFGEGPCEVYAWCLPRYRETPRPRWRIKIGRAGADGFRRRLGDFRENLPERPCYLLRIGCEDEAEAKRREDLLHAWFRERKQMIDDLPGKEWFLTNPTEIEAAIRAILIPDESTAQVKPPVVEDAMAEALKGVTAEDWESLPADLTDRLDHYLYGDQNW